MRPSAPPLPADFVRMVGAEGEPFVDDGVPYLGAAGLPAKMPNYREHHFPTIPPPPHVPRDLDDHPLESTSALPCDDTPPASGAYGIGGHPVSAAVALDSSVEVLAYALRELVHARGRVTELQENGTRLLEEARAARRETAVAAWERDTWRDKALSLHASLASVDPTGGA